MSSLPSALQTVSQSGSTELARFKTFQQTANQVQKEGFKIETIL
jgi:hypothetical protein